MEPTGLAAVAAIFVLAGGVKGITGMGLPTVAMSLLGLWLSPAQAAALLLAPSLATNVAQCRGPHLGRLAARLWPGWLAAAVVTASAPGLGGDGAAAAWASRALGLVLVGYGLWGLWRPALPDLSRRGRWLGVVAGTVTGLVSALTAVFVLPWVPYLQTLRLEKDAMVQALGLSFTIATVALAVRLQGSPHVPWASTSMLIASGAALVAAFAGMTLGERIRGRIAAATFQRALFLVFVALGVANLARGI